MTGYLVLFLFLAGVVYLLYRATKKEEVMPTDEPPTFSTPDDFITWLYPEAMALRARHGIDHRAVIAQAALETGWGRHPIVDPLTGKWSRNLFGIKGTGPAGSVRIWTHEYVNGKKVGKYDLFRAYHTVDEHLEDYVSLIQRLYPAAWEGREYYETYFQGLVSGPRRYATDPDYVKKLTSIVERRLL